MALENLGGSTVHSWINADFVPSWLRPFTLDQNTRFTRTPDHFLRPPEEAPPDVPLPSYGTAGASWHFLEMPLDVADEPPPVPSVRADLEALEQAFADLPALRAPRDGRDMPFGAEADSASTAEGWSVDEHGVETVLSWHDARQNEPGLGEGRSGDPEIAAPMAVMTDAGPVAVPELGTAADASHPVAGFAVTMPPEDVSETPATADAMAQEAPGASQFESDAMVSVAEPAVAAALDLGCGVLTAAPVGDLVDGMAASVAAPFATDLTLLDANPRPEVSESVAFAAIVDQAAADFVAAVENMDATPADLAVAGDFDGAADDADLVSVPLDGAPFDGTLAQLTAAALDGASALLGAGPSLEPAAAATLAVADGFEAGAAPSDAGPDDVMAEASAPMIPPAFDMGPDVLPEPAVGLASDLASHLASDLASHLASDSAPEVACDPARELEPVPPEPVAAESADAERADMELIAPVTAAPAPVVVEAAEIPAPAPVAVDAMSEALAPAHLRPLARLIVVGRLALPAIGEQDLLPPEPVAPAPEVETATRAASLISAHFAWQPYNLSINAGAPPVAAGPAAGDAIEPAPAAEADAVSAPVPALPVAAGLPAVVPVAEPAHDAFGYHLPPIDLLREPPALEPDYELSEEFLDQSSAMLQQVLRDFGIRGEVIDANPGPVVTLYEFEPAPGVKSSRVIALAADIARSMSAVSVRVAVVEGRNVIGIELPNRRRETVWLRELLAAHEFDEARAKLGFCLGKTIGGAPVIADLARMPHLLVAGTTGSGKSVAINTMILSLLYRHTPDACRLIMIDPKMLELSVYEGIPHLLTPVVTDPKKAIIALKWAVKEMEDRYRKMARLAVRNIDGYNARMAEAREKGEVIKRQVQVGFDKESGEALFEEQEMNLTALPYIVIIVDEMADLMMVAGKEIEGAIQRLAQMARAAGIHLVMATQRPSVDVITGTIKANFPTRISFQVTSKIDSRTILGEMGAETLLGQGDMLFMAGGGRITRVHGPFVSDQEVEHVVAFLKAQGGPEYLEDVVQDEEAEGPAGSDDAVFDKGELGESGGDLYDQAVAIVLRDRKASTSYIQRRLQVGYNKAASLMERMENEGIVGPANHAGKREILSFGRDRDDDR
ncbi:DNA translocase FtsK [Xanthobacter sp. V4C-4]|uniref:DNA translocase FtsK n=1 Tax=Xanthobacter cornucopiae TaxID=3119924 RepID=UPI00372988DC